LAGPCIEDVGAAEVGTEYSGDFWPSHELVDGEESQELCIERDLRVTRVFVDAVEEVGLFVIVWCEYDIVDDPL
jgi:hypothetical protein